MDTTTNIIFRSLTAIYDGTISGSSLYPNLYFVDNKKTNTFYEVGDDYTCFEKPDKYSIYVAGIDTSEGIHDYNTIKIINVTKRREAFVYRSRCSIPTFYKICGKWLKLYRAFAGVELNNTGHAVILGLTDVCGYTHLYKEEVDTRIIRKMSDRPKIKYGWRTTDNTRPLMLSDLKYFIEGEEEDSVEDFLPEYTVYDEFLLYEALTFINNDGKYEAEEGSFDDVLFASGIATQMYKIFRQVANYKNRGGHLGIFTGRKTQASREFTD